MKTQEKTLLVITPGFPKDETDDTCIPALQDYLISLSSRSSFSAIRVITLFYPYKEAEYVWHGISVQPLALSQKGMFNSVMVLRKAYKATKNHVLKHPPALVHSFWFRHSAVVAQKISDLFEIPHVCTLMGQDVLKTRYWKRLMPRNTPSLIAVSENQKSFSPLTITQVIPWGVNPAMIEVETRQKSYDLIGVGSLIKLKSFDRFIDIVHLLKQEWPCIKAIIVGNGPEYDRLNQKIEKAGLRENIEMTGELPRKETMERIAQSKVLLHTSRFESFCMAMAEALSLGVFTVSDQVGIAGEQPNSFIAKNNREMADIISSIFKLKQPKPQVSLYSIERTTEMYLNLYQKLVANESI